MLDENNLPIKTVIDIVIELIRLTNAGKISWTIKIADNDNKNMLEWTNDKLSTRVNSTSYTMSTGCHGSSLLMNNMMILDESLDKNPKEYHNYLRSLNCNPFTSLKSAIKGKPIINRNSKVISYERNFQKIRTTFSLLFVRRIYVITHMKSGVKYYYSGKDSMWTPMFDGPKHYIKKPNFEWLGIDYIVEEYYTIREIWKYGNYKYIIQKRH